MMTRPNPNRLLFAGLLLVLATTGCQRGGKPPAQGDHTDKPAAEKPASPPPAAPEASGPRGRWHTLTRGDLRQTVPAIGTLYPRQTSQIGPQVSGRLMQVLVQEGDRVARGQTLAVIDDALFRIELDQRQADVAAAQARLATAQQNITLTEKSANSVRETVSSLQEGVNSAREGVASAQAARTQAKTSLSEASLNLERMKNLWEKPEGGAPSIPRSRYDDANFAHQKAEAAFAAADSRVKEAQSRVAEAQSRVKEAESRVEEARSRIEEAKSRFKESQAALAQAGNAVRQAQERLTQTRLTAPYAAIITKRFLDPGAVVSPGPGAAVVELQDLSTLELEFNLPQGYLGQVREGSRLDFEVENLPGSRGQAVITLVIPTASETTRTFQCRALVKNPRLRLKPGLLAKVGVILASRRNVLWIPQTALSAWQGGWRTMLKQGGESVPVSVKTGLAAGNRVQVLGGLEEGQEVFIPEENG